MAEAKQYTILRVGANKRHFHVQRPIGGGLVNEADEVMVPASILTEILSSTPNDPSFSIQRAFVELKKIMDTKI